MSTKNNMKDIVISDDCSYMSAFLTMRCNLNCNFCLNSLDKNKEFNRTSFKEISGGEWVQTLNRIQPKENVPITFCGGEPALHNDFIYIINNLNPKLDIDILTNLQWGKRKLEEFISQVDPVRIKRDSPYASIRVSYHPEQMGNGENLVRDVGRLQDNGFSIGIWAVQYPSPMQLEAITQMQFRCKDVGIEFRVKDFTGKYEGTDTNGNNFSIIYGNYSKYPDSIFQETTKPCLCKTTELLIGPDGRAYKCHRDLFNEEFSVGNVVDSDFDFKLKYRNCQKYGDCHPCDVKLKTNYKQETGHTSVNIIFE